MGVPGLTSFVDHNKQLLSDHELHDTKVIVDGNNLFHFLYYYYHVRHQFGGDYDVFADKVRHYFNVLKRCNISPYVVFDGGYDEDDRKLKTAIKRAKERTRAAFALSIGKNGNILPILTFETFYNVLNELDVPHAVCDFEADGEIAALSREWNCPVMSNDSDFYIYDVPGFILFDYLDLSVKEKVKDPGENQTTTKYLAVQIYYLDSLLGHFKGMERNMVALFATLMGNDFVDSKEFDNFFAMGNLPRCSSKRFSTPHRQQRMLSVLMWLESAQNLENAVKLILMHTKKDRVDRVDKLLKLSIASYCSLNSSLAEYFTDRENSRITTRSKLRTKNKNPLPYWLVNGVRSSAVPVCVTNILVHHRVILLSQIENMRCATAYEASQKIRQVFYGILLSLDIELAKSEGHKLSLKQSPVTEYTRANKDVCKRSLSPVFRLDDAAEVPYLQKVPHMSVEERTSFLVKCLGEDDLSGLNIDDCFHLAVHVIPFWIRNAEPRVNILYLYALLVTFIKVGVIDNKHGTPMGNGSGRRTLRETCDSSIRSQARENITKLMPTGDRYSVQKHFEMDCVHAYSQYQACLKASMYLNQLLLCPLPNTQPEKLLNGMCYYFLYKELKQRKCPELYIEELLVRGSPLALFFKEILNKLLSLLPENALVNPEAGKKKNKKRRAQDNQKKGGKKTSSIKSEQHHSDTMMDSNEELEEDINNKFSALNMLPTE